jgi:hypothetical protein
LDHFNCTASRSPYRADWVPGGLQQAERGGLTVGTAVRLTVASGGDLRASGRLTRQAAATSAPTGAATPTVGVVPMDARSG